MAKTLVALYETFTDAEHVVQELLEDGFARSNMHLALGHTTSHAAHAASVKGDSAYEGATLLAIAGGDRPVAPPEPCDGSAANR